MTIHHEHPRNDQYDVSVKTYHNRTKGIIQELPSAQPNSPGILPTNNYQTGGEIYRLTSSTRIIHSFDSAVKEFEIVHIIAKHTA
jgi:hypothetical protein